MAAVVGEPTPCQRDLYQSVLAAEERAIACCVPGAEWKQIHLAAAVDMVGGVVDMMFGSISTALPLVKGNRLHAIALTGLARVKDLPNVPTLDELGMKGFEVEASYMLVAPAKLAPDVLKRLASAVAEINHEPETAAFAERIYARVLSGGPEETRAFLRREMEKWQGVASATGLKID